MLNKIITKTCVRSIVFALYTYTCIIHTRCYAYRVYQRWFKVTYTYVHTWIYIYIEWFLTTTITITVTISEMLIYSEHVSRLLRDCDYCCTMPYIAVSTRTIPQTIPCIQRYGIACLCVHSDVTQLTGIFLIHDPFCACDTTVVLYSNCFYFCIF